MDLSTYTGLKAVVASFLFDRTDLTDAIPAFIALAESQMNRRLRCRRMVARANLTIALSAEFVTVPTDLIGPIDLILPTTPIKRLLFLDRDTLLADKAANRYATGDTPEKYALVGDEFQLLPVSDAAYTAELTYLQRPPALSGGNASNWVLANHPDVYLYGALLQSAPYLEADSRITVWGTLFAQALDGANAGDPVPTSNGALRADDLPCGLGGRSYPGSYTGQ